MTMLSDKTQMQQMKKDPPKGLGSNPKGRDCDSPQEHKGKALSDKSQQSLMKRK
jgi:hypothetical protein